MWQENNNSMFKKRIWLFLSILLLACSCLGTPLAPFLVTEKPLESDIVGKYEFNEQKVVEDNQIVVSDSYISIFPDNTCVMSNVPIFSDGLKFEGLFTGDCQWELATHGSLKKDGKILHPWAVCFIVEELPPIQKCSYLTTAGEPYELVFSFGDPDQNTIMVFSKKP